MRGVEKKLVLSTQEQQGVKMLQQWSRRDARTSGGVCSAGAGKENERRGLEDWEK